MLKEGLFITSTEQVKQRVKKEKDFEVTRPAVCKVLKEELGLRYRKIKKIPLQANSQRCKVLRQQYALSLLSMLDSGKRIIQVDETWLNETNFMRLAWSKPMSSASVPTKAVSPSLSLIVALDTDGRVFFSLSHASTDQDTFMLFLQHLIRQLDLDTPGWQTCSCIAMDNAGYHAGEDIRSYLRKMEVPFMYSGPYAYSAASIETLFAHLKLGELNEARAPTGKQ